MASTSPGTGLILLHLQNGVVHPDGLVGRAGPAAAARRAGVVEAARSIAAHSRTAGIPVFHVVFSTTDGIVQSAAPMLRTGARDGFEEGSWSTQPAEGLFADGDILVRHTTMSAFTGTQLTDQLRSRQIHAVQLGGVSTHLVVAATAFAATDLGFTVTLLTACSISPQREAHDAAVRQISSIAAITPDIP